MAMFNIKRGFGGGAREGPGKTPAPLPKEEKKDTSIFRGKPAIPPNEAKWRIRGSAPFVPGGGRMYSEQERIKIADELLKKPGGYLKRRDVPKIYKSLKKKRSSAKTGREIREIDRKIRYLKGLLGD